MARDDPPDEATGAEFLAMARADGVSDEQALEMAEGTSGQDLRFVMETHRLAAPASEHEELQHLVRVRRDPRWLAAALPRGPMKSGLNAGMVLLLLFCAGCLAGSLAMPFAMAGPVVGLAAGIGAVLLYLAVRPAVKRLGLFSAGAFTVDAAGVVKAIAGVGNARRRVRRDGDEPGLANHFGVAVVFLLLVVFLPAAVAVVSDRPEVMLGWMVMAALALNEAPLMVLRTRRDVSDRSAEILDPEFGLALATDYLKRGGEADRLVEGVRLDHLAPAGEAEFVEVMRYAFTRRSIARLAQDEAYT